jgi:DNA-binding PadR family transcriptional regulator
MISDGQARRIASEWHGGMSSALYALTSCGAIDLDRARDEITRELLKLEVGEVRRELLALDKYVRTAGERTAVAEWFRLWDDSPVSVNHT